METSNSRTYVYKLHIEQRLTGDAELPPLDITQQKELGINLAGANYKVNFTTLKFERKVYQPGVIEAELHFVSVDGSKASSPTDLVGALLHRQVTLTMAKQELGNSGKESGEQTIASNYYVHQVRPQYRTQNNGKQNIYVKLIICSFDKLMTLSKYSRVYLAKKLSDILKKESQMFSYTDKALIKVDTNLKRLVYDFRGQQAEFIQPYLVQYNESFYDFMARVSNRCGEFLYFEDGTLMLGLPDSTVKPIKGYKTLTYQDESDPTFEVKAYARDSVKKDEGKVSELNYERVESWDEKNPFPSDIFPDHLAYNADIAPDEFIMPLFKDKSTSLSHEEWLDSLGKHIAPALFYVLRLTDEVSDMIANIAADEVASGISAGVALMATRPTWNEDFITKTQKGTYGSEKSDGIQAVQFASMDPKSWTTFNYHADILQNEEQQQKKMLCVDMGATYTDLRLGDRVRIGDDERIYVIVQISLDTSTQSQVFHAIPAMDKEMQEMDEKGNSVGKPKYEVDPYGKDVYPPVYEGGVFRKASPQKAFVVANNDPKLQGRVRIIYPWQSTSAKLKSGYKNAKEVALMLEDAIAKKKAEYDALSESMTKKQENLTLLEQVANCTNQADRDAARKNTKEKLKAEKTANQTAIQDADTKINSNNSEIELQKKALAKLQGKPDASMVTISQKQLTISNLEKENQQLEADKARATSRNAEIDVMLEKLDDDETLKAYINQQKDELKADRKKQEELKKEIDATQQKKETADNNFQMASKEIKEERIDMASPWIRVSTPLATEGGGTFFMLDIGDEVMVDYENGNVERPYVVGSLYSKNKVSPLFSTDRAATPSPVRNPTMALMSRNGHSITFKDTDNPFLFYGSFIPGLDKILGPMAAMIPGIKDIRAGKNLTGGIQLRDTYGLYTVDLNSTSRNITIRSGLGNVILDAFTGITISAPNGDIKIAGKNIELKAYNKIDIISGANIHDKGVSNTDDRTTGEKIKRYAKEAWNYSLKLIMQKAVEKLGSDSIDLTFFRTIAEVFLRPIDGTMCIKSKRYMLLEAGHGEAQIPANRFAESREGAMKTSQNTFRRLKKSLEQISRAVDGYFDSYITLFNNIVGLSKSYDLLTSSAFKKDLFIDVLQDAHDSGTELDEYEKEDIDERLRDVAKPDANDIVYIMNKLALEMNKLHQLVAQKTERLELKNRLNDQDYFATEIKEALNDLVPADEYQKWKEAHNDTASSFATPLDANDANVKKEFVLLKRQLVATFLDKIKSDENVKKYFNFGIWDDYKDYCKRNEWWKDFVNNLDVAVNGNGAKQQLFDIFVKPFTDQIGKEKKEWSRIWYDRKEENVWNQQVGGQILMSDNANYTYHINKGDADNQPSVRAQEGVQYPRDMMKDIKNFLLNITY